MVSETGQLVVVIFCVVKMDDKLGMSGMVNLNPTNYSTWKTRMEDILYVKDLYEPILNENVSTGVTQKE